MAATWHTSGHARDKARNRLRRLKLPCHICGQPIDYTLTTPHPQSFELDHIKPVSTHPELSLDPKNHAPAHRACNRDKWDGPVDGSKQLPTSRAWL
jgi:5-methylcytosine-specific restriction endonuclease McrA